jgi:hypothetical protein
MISLPTKFKLAGSDWTVLFEDNLGTTMNGDWEEIDGITLPEDKVIKIHGSLKEPKMRDHMYHTFFHELTHAIDATLGFTEDFYDEQKTDSKGAMMHQFLKTKRGNLTKDTKEN